MALFIPFDAALVLFGIEVVGDAHEQQVVGVLGDLRGILLALDLLDSGVNGLIVFQLDDEGWRIDILARDEHQVSKALT